MNFFFRSWPDSGASLGLLSLRIVAGLGMMLHGWPKIQNPMGWMGDGAPVPGILQACAALAEFGGGLAWIVGFLTPLASVGLVINMLVAVFMVLVPKGLPFVAGPGQATSELGWLYLVIAALFATNGPGRYSLDWLLFGRNSRRESTRG